MAESRFGVLQCGNQGAIPSKLIQPNPQIPTMLQYNLDIEQQIVANMVLTVGYVGSDAYHQARASNPQIPTPVLAPAGRFIIPYSTVAATTATPVNPALSGTTTFDTFDANSSYNALQVTLEKRISHGLLFKGVFAWAKTIKEDPDPHGHHCWNYQQRHTFAARL